jgi:hypothetical protein
MRLGGCAREKEVAELLGRGHWPEASSDELRAHVGGCRACKDFVAVRQAFRADRLVAGSAARLESPGVLWWRAQLRRRNAAIERISRPILGAQIFAVGVSLVAAMVYLLSQGKRGFAWLAWFEQVPRALHLEALLPDGLQKYQGETWLVLSLVAMLAMTSGVIVYVVSEKR